MRKVKVVAIGILLMGSSLSCNKIEKYDNLDLLVDKEWRLTNITDNGEEVVDSCQLDNTLLFNKKGEIAFDFGLIICEEEYSFEEWKFQKEYSEIRFKGSISGNGISGGSIIDRREVVQLTDSILVLKETYPAETQGMPKVFTYEAD